MVFKQTKKFFPTENECDTILDLAFLVDSSGSIRPVQWFVVLNFLKRFIDEFEVSPSGNHFASISYSTMPKVDFRFNTLAGNKLNSYELKRLVDKIPHQKGYTFIDKGLLLANEKIFSVEGGMRPAVRKVSQRCILSGQYGNLNRVSNVTLMS